MTLRVTLPQARFASRRFGKRDWAELLMDGSALTGKTGQPGIPTFAEQFGVPTGAGVSVKASKVSSYTLKGVNLLPYQPEPGDAVTPPEFRDRKFALDRKAYRSKRLFPRAAAKNGPLGAMRDLRVGEAQLTGGQYRARRHKLRVITGMDLEVTFGGANQGTFGDARLTDPFNATFNRIYRSALRNYDVVAARPGASVSPSFCGEEVLIVTSAALRPAADTLRAQKQGEGFLTSVVEAGDGPGQIGSTNTAIQAFIRSHLNSTCWLRPSYVILIGDTSHVPTFLVPCKPGGDAAACQNALAPDIASDLPYSLADDGDFLADTALGRIPAPDLATANTVVNKIVGYESAPPAPDGADFYRHIAVTAKFEPTYICELNDGESGTPNCDAKNPPVTGHYVYHPEITQDARGFTKTSEAVRGAMVKRGYSVDRLYWAMPDANPQTYNDGTPMPAAIKKPGFTWDTTTAQFLDAFNTGRTIVFHRDHGGKSGWSSPDLNTANVPSMTNGSMLPVAFGINCSSGAFDSPGSPSLAERLIQRDGGGAVGVFGDTRVSSTSANNVISFGFFDALFPNLLPDYGAADPLQRMGDVLLAGKQYLASAAPNHTYGHGHLYHYFGDPTMQLWIASPLVFDPARVKALVRRDPYPGPRPPGPGPDPPPFWVLATVEQSGAEGALVTLEQRDGATIGRGVVHNGQAAILPRAQPRSTLGMKIKLQDDGFFAAEQQVQGG